MTEGPVTGGRAPEPAGETAGREAAWPEPTRQVAATVLRYGREDGEPRRLAVPVETPVEVAFGGIPFAVMMLTPQDLEDFAYGFSLSEGMVEAAGEVRRVDVTALEGGLRIDLDLRPDRMARHLARRRAMTGRTGCGVCGIEDLRALERGGERRLRAPDVAAGAVARAVAGLEAGQVLNAETRSVHAAAWADQEGRILHLREDVGRHNALDKLIGALLRAGIGPGDGFVVITSRCSFEMVDKAAAFGAGMLVAVSGPTSFALDKAERLGMALFGIARRDGVTAFTGSGARKLAD